MSKARTVMIQGTASDVGKSLLTAALCRIFSEDGYRTAPFKSQNMSLNAYVTWDGKEIGRAQGMQADACGILATTDMNPILLKPKKDMVSQVIVHGEAIGDYEASAYRSDYLTEAGSIVRAALERLRSIYDILVLEGAGSPAEINLKDRDIVNMQAAQWADAPVLLAADIDRGGVFASIVGTMELLEPHERQRVAGFIINKFRGDIKLLQPGLDWLEKRTGLPVLGVVPYLPNLSLEDEDSLSLDTKLRQQQAGAAPGKKILDIVVIRLPRIANFTDIDPLHYEPDVAIRYVDRADAFGNPDAVILPGSKNTVDDLLFLRQSGLESKLLLHTANAGQLLGVCGGYEMMGQMLYDPLHRESDVSQLPGLKLLPFTVHFEQVKRTVRVAGRGRLPGMEQECSIQGYEIHTGTIVWQQEPLQPFQLQVASQASRQGEYGEGGCTPDGRQWGTFIHGILHNDDYRRQWLNRIRADKGLPPLAADSRFLEHRTHAFDRLALHVRQHVDIKRIYTILGT